MISSIPVDALAPSVGYLVLLSSRLVRLPLIHSSSTLSDETIRTIIIRSKGELTDLYSGERPKPVSDAKKVPFQALLFLMSRGLNENAGVSQAVRGFFMSARCGK
jgi:hypothetical protein